MNRLSYVAMIVCTLVAAAPAAEQKPNTLSKAELNEGWILLFDGETIFGWKSMAAALTPGPSPKGRGEMLSDANWRAADGTIAASQGKPGLLCTTSQFGNYELKVDFRAAKGVNSGVFLHTIPNPTRADLTTKCYEVNIAGDADAEWPSGSIVDRQKPVSCKVENEEDKVIGQRRTRLDERGLRPIDPSVIRWKTLDIRVCDGRIVVKLNKKTVADYTDPKPLGRGPIGLQFRTGKIEFRNVKLRPLGMKSIFNGKDLTGWKPYPGQASVCSVTPEGWLHLHGGRGQLETVGRYADFTLQAEIFVNGRELNSGFFFRSVPGELQRGYESQIHNGYLNNDRNKPNEYGTGGIYNRQHARRVVADDLSWFHKTLHADGPHVAAWVNGYQVSDWIDTRPPSDNPRQGLRLAAGTISIQGHDAATDVMLRNICIAELPAR